MVRVGIILSDDSNGIDLARRSRLYFYRIKNRRVDERFKFQVQMSVGCRTDVLEHADIPDIASPRIFDDVENLEERFPIHRDVKQAAGFASSRKCPRPIVGLAKIKMSLIVAGFQGDVVGKVPRPERLI